LKIGPNRDVFSPPAHEPTSYSSIFQSYSPPLYAKSPAAHAYMPISNLVSLDPRMMPRKFRDDIYNGLGVIALRDKQTTNKQSQTDTTANNTTLATPHCVTFSLLLLNNTEILYEFLTVFMKLFKTKNISSTVMKCQLQFRCNLLRSIIQKRAEKFIYNMSLL